MARKKKMLVLPEPKEGMSRYGFKDISPELLHEIRLVVEDLKKSIERYLLLSYTIKWRKFHPFHMALKRFYTKYQLHICNSIIVQADDSVLGGSVDPDTYLETSRGLRLRETFDAIKDELWK